MKSNIFPLTITEQIFEIGLILNSEVISPIPIKVGLFENGNVMIRSSISRIHVDDKTVMINSNRVVEAIDFFASGVITSRHVFSNICWAMDLH